MLARSLRQQRCSDTRAAANINRINRCTRDARGCSRIIRTDVRAGAPRRRIPQATTTLRCVSEALLWSKTTSTHLECANTTASTFCTCSLSNHYKLVEYWFITYVISQSTWSRPGVSSQRDETKCHDCMYFTTT